MAKKTEKNNLDCAEGTVCGCAGKCGCADKKCGGPLSILSRVFCGLIFVGAATLILLQIFGVITLAVNTGILAALTALAIVAVYSLFHLFWAGLFFMAATIITIMSGNGIVFSLPGESIGGLFIAAALLTVAFHLIFRNSPKKYFSVERHADANFGTTTKYFNDELDTVALDCNFGQVRAYFENAVPKDGKSTVEIDCNFGKMELYFPKEWKVVNKVRSSFSGTENTNHPRTSDDSPVVTLTGEVNFGGIVITYI